MVDALREVAGDPFEVGDDSVGRIKWPTSWNYGRCATQERLSEGTN